MPTETIADLKEKYERKYASPQRLGNPVRDVNPLILFGCGIALAIAAVAAPREILAPLAACVLLVIFGFCSGAKVGKRFLSTYAKLFLVVGGILFILRIIFLPGEHVYWGWGPFQISQESIVGGARFAFVVMALCGVLVLFFILVPAEHLMHALQRTGMSPRATYVVLSSFQSISDLQANAKVVMEAQKSRGIETEGGFFRRIAAFFPVLTPVFLAAMGQTEERALALDARAFNAPERPKPLVYLPRVGAGQWLLSLVALAVAVGSIVWTVMA